MIDAPQDISYQVMVSGTCFYETDDQLIADAIKWNYETIGWKNITIKEVE